MAKSHKETTKAETPTIIICAAAHGGFAVTVEPSQGEACEHLAQCHRGAYGFAVGLRMTHRWPIVDMASDAALDRLLGGGAS